MAEAGSYNNSNFVNTFGTVSCPGGDNVAWLKCAKFDTCKIAATTNQGMKINRSYWGVQGWEITTAASDTYGTCFNIMPSGGTEITHIIFANNVANVCSDYGFSSNGIGGVSADYVAIVGNIAYNATTGTAACGSGISFYLPAPADNLPGTHIYIAGNYSYENYNHNPCAGGVPTDGEGIILDTLNANSYNQQIAIENNLVFLNGGRGIEENANFAAHVYIENNTMYGDNGDGSQNYYYCSDLQLGNQANNTTASNNLAVTNSATGCGGHTPLYAVGVLDSPTSTNVVEKSFIDGADGNNLTTFGSPEVTVDSSNIMGVSPAFANPVNPGAPNCSGAVNVPGCMATAIANYTPTNPAAKAYGYQMPSTTPNNDPLFPKWLCNVNLPPGLVTMGCVAGS